MDDLNDLKIETAKVSDLVPYANNAKIHTDAQVDTICESIKEFGFNDPIGVWHNENGEAEIVEGHGRVLAAEKLGIKEVPIIALDRLSDEQRRAYTHVHNQTTMNSGWDFDTLDKDIDALIFDWESFGFDISENDCENNLYSDKTAGLIYEPSGIKPSEYELVDTEGYLKLIEIINESEVPNNIKGFLRFAACRFLEFDYEKIADYYCESEKEIRKLFEMLRLVIVDKDRFIEAAAIELVDDMEGIE